VSRNRSKGVVCHFCWPIFSHGWHHCLLQTILLILKGQDRSDEIERGLLVQYWVAEAILRDLEEAKTETDESVGDSQSDENNGVLAAASSCPICRKRFETGNQVCSSRNTQCRHQFHKHCMSNWLQYQHACPVCNQDYLITPAPTST
jgi:Ring finger domain